MEEKKNLQRWVVIDDEIHLRKGLQKLFVEHAKNWLFAGEANNGEDGWSLIQHVNPDLAIVDIRMPLKTGIEIAKLVKEHQLSTHIIILTGYKDFDYAQAAVKYGVVDFLLKPIRPNELLLVIERLYQLLIREKMEQEIKDKYHKQEMIRNAFLGLPIETKWQSTISNERNNNNSWLIRNFAKSNKFSGNLHLLQFALQNICEDVVSQHGSYSMYIAIEYDSSILLIENLLPNQEEVINEIKQHINSFLANTDIVIQALEVGGSESWFNCYQRYRKKVELEPILHNNQLFEMKTLEMTLLLHIERGNYSGFKETFTNTLLLLKSSLLPINSLKSDVNRLYSVIHFLTKKLLSSDKLIVLPPQDELDRCTTREQLIESVEACYSLVTQSIEHWLQSTSNQIVERAHLYMESHYQNNCSLTEVASYLHVNAAYLSDLMKRETGMSFVKTLTDIRIRHAKFLLLNTDLRVADIAANIGYDDPNYFSALFGKINGDSPNRFRKNNKK